MPISKPHSSLASSNKGSCKKLALYLEKENIELEKLMPNNNSLKELALIENRKQYFFSHDRDKCHLTEVIDSIDSNIKKLGKKDEKFFSPTISFSQDELQHLLRLASNKNHVKHVWELEANELKKYNDLIKSYVRKVMDNYAMNFNRQSRNLKNGGDLIFFAKIENFRRYKGTDKEVKSGKIKSGTYKNGLNTHVHCIVSRKDKTQKLKLKPTVNDRKTDRTINGNNYRVGFDRLEWSKMNERTFDKLFKYKRKLSEMLENQMILKNGSLSEINDLKERIEKEKRMLDNNLNLNIRGINR